MDKFRVGKRINIVIILVISMLINIAPRQYDMISDAASTGMIEYGSYVNFREGPGTGYSIKKDKNGSNIVLDGGTPLEILATETGSDYTWYKVNVTYNGTVYTGYVCADYVVLNGSSGGDAPSADIDFEAYLSSQGFPESYKSMLRTLHEKYPAWRFEAIQTGIKWSTLVEKEVNRGGQIKNLVWTSNSYPHYNWRSTQVGYNWATDKWTPYDGSVWFAASDELVSYYLDPRTYLYENYIFLFESLSYQNGVQTKEGVEAILKGTFMYDAIPPNETQKYSEIIMEAAAASGVIPYQIASRIRLEMGTTAGTAANGNSSKYPGIYNFYNIGATDGGNALEKGLKWASESGTYGRPWNTVKKSIVGGAQFLGTAYINVGQDTLYTQKFNVTNKNCLFIHQYMTNVQAPSTECLTSYNAYKKNNLLNTGMVFKIPVYTDMPQTAVTKPADSGNPNNWLSSLSVSGYSLTPSFSVNETSSYSVTVPSNVANITISATTVNSKASISGTGSKQLSSGSNVFTVSVKAQNGNVRNYTITVNRGNQVGTKKGDLNGDGNISAIDIVFVQRIIVGIDKADEGRRAIADINGDGNITALDIVMMQRHIIGLQLIN